MNIGNSVAALLGALSLLSGCADMPYSAAGKRELMLVANDEKQSWDEAGRMVLVPGGKDTVSIVDIGTDPLAPKIIVNLPLANTIVGPPVNLAIAPDESIALVANSSNVVEEGGARKLVPDNRLWVIDLTTSPPRLIDTLTLGKQALVAKFPGHKIAFLDVNGEKVTYDKLDVPVGLWPYNVDVTPDGKLALTADNGNAGAADGSTDTVSVIDIEANPPRVIDKVVVGDAPEGLAVSPTGKMAVVALIKGSNSSRSAYFYNRNASVVALKIDGKKVTRSNEVEVRGLPEGVVFSQDGRYVYVGNYNDRDVSILRVEGDQLVNTGKTLPLPGQPAAMRGKTLF